MKQTQKPELQNSLQVDRRGFLTGVSVVMTGLPLQGIGMAQTAAALPQGPARAALHQELPYFSFEPGAQAYVKPKAASTTRNYVASLSEEEFLRRHWFS